MKTKTQANGSTLPVAVDRLVRLPEVRLLTGLSKTSIYNGVKARTFPDAVRVTDYAVAWRQSDLDRWIASRMPAELELAAAARAPRAKSGLAALSSEPTPQRATSAKRSTTASKPAGKAAGAAPGSAHAHTRATRKAVA